MENCIEQMRQLACCVIIPTFNNASTLGNVIESVSEYASDIIVVNDGSTDNTAILLGNFSRIEVISYLKNKGKGHALSCGFQKAIERGFKYAITLDSDGQHYADDIPIFLKAIRGNPQALLIGSRNLNEENMPSRNSFGNKFSNFWFQLETGLNLPDTQSGFRLYPLESVKKIKLFTARYEFELEIMVKLAWQDVPVLPVKIKVYYAEKNERVSHFRPITDFLRISVLNTYFVILALLWYRPVQLLKRINYKSIRWYFHNNFLNSEESTGKKALSISFGVFMGIIPIWGYQLASAILLAHFLKLNKAIVAVAANISIPPFIPFILFGSLKTGQWVLGQNAPIFANKVSFELIKQFLPAYIIGSFIFAIFLSVFFGLLFFSVIKIYRVSGRDA